MKTFLICLYLSLEHSAYNLFSFQYHWKVIIKNINSCFMTLRVYWIVQSFFFFLNSPTGLSCVFLHSYSYIHVLYLCPLLVVTVLTVPLSISSSLFGPEGLSSSLTKEGSGFHIDKVWKVPDDVVLLPPWPLGHPGPHQAYSILGPCTWCSLSGLYNLGFTWNILFYSVITLQHLPLLALGGQNGLVFISKPFYLIEWVRSVPSFAFLWHGFLVLFFFCSYSKIILHYTFTESCKNPIFFREARVSFIQWLYLHNHSAVSELGDWCWSHVCV